MMSGPVCDRWDCAEVTWGGEDARGFSDGGFQAMSVVLGRSSALPLLLLDGANFCFCFCFGWAGLVGVEFLRSCRVAGLLSLGYMNGFERI